MMAKRFAPVILAFLVGLAIAASAQISPESQAYSSCLRQRDPSKQASMLETFLRSYPNSSLKPDALTTLLAAYKKARSLDGTRDAAQRLLLVCPDNLDALSSLTYLLSLQGSKEEARQYGEHGLQVLEIAKRPSGVVDADWSKRKSELKAEFNRVIGFDALEKKITRLLVARYLLPSRHDLQTSALHTGYHLRFSNPLIQPIVLRDCGISRGQLTLPL